MEPEDHELEKLMQNLMRMENKEKDEWHAKVVNINPNSHRVLFIFKSLLVIHPPPHPLFFCRALQEMRSLAGSHIQ
jgi:hypothetical protein